MSKNCNTYEVIYTEKFGAFVKAKNEAEALIKGKELWESDEQEEYFGILYSDNEEDDWRVIEDNDYTGGDIYSEEKKTEEPNLMSHLTKEISELQKDYKNFNTVWSDEDKKYYEGKIKSLKDILEWVNNNEDDEG